MSLCADAKVCEIVLLSRATLEMFLVIYFIIEVQKTCFTYDFVSRYCDQYGHKIKKIIYLSNQAYWIEIPYVS